ncbi:MULTISPECIES: flagellar basal-body MS-ring/collar protein FliF [Halomonadaceae]|uniref:flagellar basal-body MS-ring/collar protein FliF n=1 Tax=Halomonadaceae TaxID=28256 RepID=UPI00159A9949|nr:MULTISPECIES: flagellar basal-body MS-ring/collar protein FliF [Halomonas]QJQ94395.1 flagellar M-ring protein FliF [Halomonas sp. PA5]
MSDASRTTGASTVGAAQPASATAETAGRATTSQLLDQMRANPLVPLLIAGAAVVAIVIALLMWASSPEYRVLYSNLNEADGGRIIGELDQRGVAYRFSEGGQTLLVPSDQVHTLRLQLAEKGLPQGGNVGFELMDNQAFGVSQFAEHINFQRGLEGELARSIESLGPVTRARIHLAMAKPSVFVRDREPAKASVVLTLHAGRSLSDGQVNAIIHMVSSSVSELAADDVTVIDHTGRLLSKPGGAARDLDGTQLNYIEEVERSYQRRIENILAPILGSQNLRAQVAAQIDFSSREETSERFGPNQAPNEAAVRSSQLSTSYSGSDDIARGIPGALTNTPPGAAPSLIELQETDEDGEPINDPTQPPSNLRHDNVVNYEVDRNIAHIQHRRGQIERLSVAVVVNYREERDAEGELARVPLSDAELNQINRLVRQAMGFSEIRGDEIEVVNSPFTLERDETIEYAWWESPEIQALALTLGRYLLVAFIALLLYLLILRPLIKRHTQQPVLANAALEPGFRAVVGDDDENEQEAAKFGEGDDERGDTPLRKRRKSNDYEQNLKDAREMAQEDPRLVAMIVRSWMNKYE